MPQTLTHASIFVSYHRHSFTPASVCHNHRHSRLHISVMPQTLTHASNFLSYNRHSFTPASLCQTTRTCIFLSTTDTHASTFLSYHWHSRQHISVIPQTLIHASIASFCHTTNSFTPASFCHNTHSLTPASLTYHRHSCQHHYVIPQTLLPASFCHTTDTHSCQNLSVITQTLTPAPFCHTTDTQEHQSVKGQTSSSNQKQTDSSMNGPYFFSAITKIFKYSEHYIILKAFFMLISNQQSSPVNTLALLIWTNNSLTENEQCFQNM